MSLIVAMDVPPSYNTRRIIEAQINDRIGHVKSARARARPGEKIGLRGARTRMRLFHFPLMVKPFRLQVISANIKKYFTSIHGHGILIPLHESRRPPLFAATNMHSNRNSMHSPREPRFARSRFYSVRWIN